MAEKEPGAENGGAPGEGITTELTKEQAAKLVKRVVPIIKDGKPSGETKEVSVKADEVLSFKEFDDRVVVVTVDGQKLTGAKA
ncbi:MAG: hypothetical protein ACOY4U_04525 [Pseudomonadota bacterium]